MNSTVVYICGKKTKPLSVELRLTFFGLMGRGLLEQLLLLFPDVFCLRLRQASFSGHWFLFSSIVRSTFLHFIEYQQNKKMIIQKIKIISRYSISDFKYSMGTPYTIQCTYAYHPTSVPRALTSFGGRPGGFFKCVRGF